MKTTKPLVLGSVLAVSFLSTSFASAAGVTVFYDKSTGMPRCMKGEDANQKEVNVFLRYKGDRFQKTVTALKLWNWPGCENWESLDKSPKLSGDLNKAKQFTVGNTTTGAFGLTIPAKVLEAFKQAKVGGSIFRAEATASEYIKKNRLTEYTVPLNRELTRKYGFGFASEVYRKMTEADALNSKLVKEVLANYEKARTGQLSKVSKRGENLTFVFAPGLGGSPEQPRDAKGNIVKRDVSDMMRIAEELQVEFGKRGGEQTVQVLNINANGSMAGNREMIRHQLDKLLSEGKRIVIIGVCKGMAETVSALGILSPKMNRSGYGEVVGVLNLSGYLGGSRLSTFIASRGPFNFLKWLSARTGGVGPIKKDLLNILPETTEQNVQDMMAEAFPLLPKNAVYMNLVGIMPGDGTGIIGSGKQLQDMVIRKGMEHYQYDYGANDGYIEFPGTVIPRSYGLSSDVLPLHSDHYLITGKFFGLDLTKDAIRKNFYRALFHTMFDRMKAKGTL